MRLGGLKILEQVSLFQCLLRDRVDPEPRGILRLLAQEKVNLPYVELMRLQGCWHLSFLVEGPLEARVSELLARPFPRRRPERAAVFSVFPHGFRAEVAGMFFKALAARTLTPCAVTQSSSAISVVLRVEAVAAAREALFETFDFGRHHTPAHWQAAQEGKQGLYREVVASYQERKPKVYALEWRNHQAGLESRLPEHGIAGLAETMQRLGRDHGWQATFVTGFHSPETGIRLLCCMPEPPSEALDGPLPWRTLSEVAVFSMNGPHFGDRYGIAGRLLTALDEARITPLAVGCTVASITGAVAAEKVPAAVAAIERHFDVPRVEER